MSHRFLTDEFLRRSPGKNLCCYCRKPVTIPGNNWEQVYYSPKGVYNSFFISYGHIICPNEEPPFEEDTNTV